jgi:3-deoxy-7-phosphoheptulonate synthase
MNNENIEILEEITSCSELKKKYPVHDTLKKNIIEHRNTIKRIIKRQDHRKLVIVGPCSIHDYDLALDYAHQLKKIQEIVNDGVFIVMRVYFEKPRTTVGWKGFINDPDLDNSCDINKGLCLARNLLIEINKLGLPVGCEFLDTISPQYFSELISWGAIGARTVESQLHRQLASGLSMPIGFKNSTSGRTQEALDAILSAKSSHVFFGIDENNKAVRVKTKGNPHCHIVLRGGVLGPNYYEEFISEFNKKTKKEISIIIDCSHGNSQKNYLNQIKVFEYLTQQLETPEYKNCIGMMLESNIHAGKQSIKDNLDYGVSVTDACIDISQTRDLIYGLYKKLIIS